MAEQTGIAWTDSTWNPIFGCSRVSPGCEHCYIPQAPPLRVRGYKLGEPIIEAAESTWNLPFKWNKKPWVCDRCGHADSLRVDHQTQDGKICYAGIISQGPTFPYWHRRRVFAPSLSDWLHPSIKVATLARFLDTIRRCPDLDFILCTKRPELFFRRIGDVLMLETHSGNEQQDGGRVVAQLWCEGQAPKNVWILATAEDQKRADERIPHLLKIPAVVRGLSCEPLLEDLDLRQLYVRYVGGVGKTQIDWVIVGGESGPNARPCNIAWIHNIKDQCQQALVPVFVKQLGSNSQFVGVDRSGDDANLQLHLNHKKGGDPSEWPADLRVQQFPRSER